LIHGLEEMAGGTSSDVGTGGMMTKVNAAKIVTGAGADMVIANGDNIYAINDINGGEKSRYALPLEGTRDPVRK
jgi:glutamate 5-kinase